MLNSEIVIRRLALIKFLYIRGVEMSMQPEIIAGFSILSFHDSIEMFLILAAEHNDVKKIKSLNFMEFWDKIPQLTMRNQMEALKDRRVAIKHRCQFPSKQDIEISRINTMEFFVENTSAIFNIDFNAISLANLISSNDVRSLVTSAEQKLIEKDIYGSLCNSRHAFHTLFSQYEYSKSRFEHWDSLLNIGKRIGTDFTKLVGHNDRNGYNWFKQVTDTTNQLRDILKYTALGVDYRKYVFFNLVAPEIHFVCKKDGPDVEAKFDSIDNYEYSKNLRTENAKFCIEFVIECSLKLQDFDFDRSQIFKTQAESEAWFQAHRKE